MVKKNKYLNYIVVFLFFVNIQFIVNAIINYPSSIKGSSGEGKTEYFEINIKKEIKTDFLRIYVQSRKNNINQEVILSTTIQKPNRANATLFAEEPYGDVFLYVPREIIKDTLFLNCTCYSKKCPVVVILSETNYLNISRDGQHSFLSNPPLINYKYYIKRAQQKNDSFYDQNAIMTFFIIGTPDDLKINISYIYPDNNKNISIPIDYIKNDNGYITSFKEDKFKYNENGLYEIVCKSNIVNYITVGSRSTVEGLYEKANHIYPNKRGIFGYFNKSMLSGECYWFYLPYLNIDNKELKEYNLYANYLVFSETAEVYFINKITSEEIKSKTTLIEGELGVIVTLEDIRNNAICIRPSSEKKNVLYYLELNDYNIGRSNNSIYSPQISGHIYTRYLPVNTHLFFIHKQFALPGDEIKVKTIISPFGQQVQNG